MAKRSPRNLPANETAWPEQAGWTTESLKEYLDNQVRSLEHKQALVKDVVDQNIIANKVEYNTKFYETDVRYQQRFDAQEKAVRDALAGQEKAVNAALMAADRAVAKAEIASDKRFEAVNEFRAQLADQAATLLPRSEYNAQYKSLFDKNEADSKRIEGRLVNTVPHEEFDVRIKGLTDGMAADSRRISQRLDETMPRQEFVSSHEALVASTTAAFAEIDSDISAIREAQALVGGRSKAGERLTGILLSVGAMFISLAAVIALIVVH